ncbi:uncharacterized protein LOC105691641 isoform X2 [Athalia rosae]|uniref:uncharacterized protein LOC105691641 isoform X2 n=1 Tax=Athalia rosae TaxID=37344 RepID=UPI002034378F|nr:uncharacterized protein LOC105691641 isoform X2 [Athalia rosae]
MENYRKKIKLMSSRSVPGAGVAIVGCGVLINAGSDGGGGGEVVGGSSSKSGGVLRGVGAMAAVRGRTLPGTGQRERERERERERISAQDGRTSSATTIGKQSTASSGLSSTRSRAVASVNNFGFTSAKSLSRSSKHPGRKTLAENRKDRDQDKENATEPSSYTQSADERRVQNKFPPPRNTRSAKRVREKEGDGTNEELPRGDQNLRPPRVTALRMSKNVGESRIPLPGTIRASFLPKPRIAAQQKTGILDGIPQNAGHGGVTAKSVAEDLNIADKCRQPITSTPSVDSKGHRDFPFSPVECVTCEDVGQKVCVGSEKIGILRYYGALEGEIGAWCGVELPEPEGLNDGTVRGLRYFSCPENHGVMAPATKVHRIDCGPPKPRQNVFKVTALQDTTDLRVNDKTNTPDTTFITGHRPGGDGGLQMFGISEKISSGNPAANSTFLPDWNTAPDATFDKATDWKFCSKGIPGTSPVNVGKCPGETNEKKLTNETRNLDEKKNERNSSLNADSAADRSKTPSPTSKGKNISVSRLVSPTIFGKSAQATNLTFSKSPNAKSKGNLNEHETTKIIAKKVGTSPTNGEAKKNATKLTEPGKASTTNVNPKGGTDSSPHRRKSEKTSSNQAESKVNDLTVDLIKNPTGNSTVIISPVQKPTGAIFTLNETFMNEKSSNANAAQNLDPIFYGDKAPVVEIPFTERRAYLCGSTISPGKEIVVNSTFDKPGAALNPRSNSAKLERGFPSGTAVEDTFLLEGRVGPGRTEFTKEKRNDETFSLIDFKSDIDDAFDGTFVFSKDQKNQRIGEKSSDSTFSMTRNIDNNHKNGGDPLSDTFLVKSGNRRSVIISGRPATILDASLESTFTKEPAVGLPNIFHDSKLSQIRSVEDSCLIDSTATNIGGSDDTWMFDDPMETTVRSSMGQFEVCAFQNSKDNFIDDVGDSCLIDTTLRTTIGPDQSNLVFEDLMNNTAKIEGRPNSKTAKLGAANTTLSMDATSGPYSLLALNGADEEDELTPPAAPPPSKATPAPHYLMLNKQNSFEHDESLGILTPDQMAEFSMALECSRTPSCENLTGSGGSRIAMTRASASRPSDLPTSVDNERTEGSSERTPSPEDLPLDPKPAEPTRTVPVSFITSVTSITSLEAGYQGDGENSRPASRGADPAPVAPPPNLPAPRNDPMTDSDFFTESDADAHEEIVRGDRRAQVIDGTLFCAPGGRRCPSFTGEEMDSSGIYSDLDRRQDEPTHEEAQSEGQTPDTADTESQKSQPSPHQMDAQQIQQHLQLQQQQPVIMDCLMVPPSVLDISAVSNDSVGTLEATVIEVECQAPPAKVLNKSDPVPLKKYKMPKRNVVSKIKAMIESGPKDESEKETRRPQRTPRKGGRWDAVMSKIEAGKTEQRSRPVRKEVKSRVLQSLGPPATTSNRRSPGDSAKSKRRTRGRQDVTSPTQETAQSSVHSSMSDISSAPRSAKKRLGSPGGSEGSAQSTPRVSSPRQQQPPSSLTIVNNVIPGGGNTNNNNSVVVGNGTNNINNHNNNHNNNGNNIQQNSACRPIPSHSQRSPTAGTPPRRPVNGRAIVQQSRISNSEAKKNSLDISRVNLEKSPSAARKPAVPRRSSSNVAPKTLQNVSPPKDRGAKETTPAVRGPVETREQAHQTDPTHEEIHLKQAEVSVQALSVIVQYLAHQLDGFSAPRLKKDCERMKTEWLETRLEAEELRAGYRRVEQQLTEQHDERQRALDQLRAELESRHASRLSELETTLQEERQKCEARLQDSINNSDKELQVTIARLRTEHEADIMRKEAETDRRSVVHDQGAALRAEAESLRTVLELRSQEIAALRAENDNLRREVEIKDALEAKVIALEARSEDLKAQLQRKETFERQLSHENKVLLESFHQESKQNKRLSQHNEELQWRLRQNNEVVTVLANQLATPPQRLTRSLGPELTGHSQSPDDSPPASPMVKSMVEKSDSISWTLEIEESPEAMASRLLRRSGSSRGISPSDSRPKRPRPPSSSSPVTATTVSRQSSLRTSTPQRAVVLRARSKSVSVADAIPQESSWPPQGFTSTQSAVRRRPRSDPAANSVVAVQESSPGLRPQEAGGEAMISEETSASSSSEDESSANSDIPRLAMELSWSESEG